ncbi:MAG: peptide ABC transporter substrate-binding protein [Simkaniaceae bacterium]|nr:peptide ABC transporter substrate-binding protein [Simkaniaceae bacterium]
MHRLTYLLALSLFLFSCSKDERLHFTEKHQLNLNYPNEPETLDPRKGAAYVSSSMHFFLYEGLTRMTPERTATPAVAERIDISDDHLTYTFHLRDCSWSNGSPITARDFRETWLDMLSPRFPCPNAHLLYSIKNAKKAKHGEAALEEVGIYVKDRKTLVVELEMPTPYFLELVAFCVFSPVHQEIIRTNPNWADELGPDLVGNGPYIISKWKHGAEILLEKNPYYWDQENIRLEKIHFSFINSPSTALQMFEKGQLDMLGGPFTGIPEDSIPMLKESGQIETHPFTASTATFFNVSKFPFNNKNIRKAFAYAINRKDIVENITQLDETPATDTVPPILKNMRSYRYFNDGDHRKAIECFEKGLKELCVTRETLGPLVYMHASTDAYPKIAQALQEQWRKVLGVKVTLQGFEYRTFMDHLVKRDFQFSQARWVAQYNDQMNILERFQYRDNPKNYSGWENESYSQIIQDSAHYPKVHERYDCLEMAEAIVSEEMPFTVLYHWNNVYLKQPYIKDLYIHPTGGFHLYGIHFDQDTLAECQNQFDEKDDL